ncbi:MAG: LysE family translocator [Methylocystaceae bacterium]|nr:LysE family translocator [Methylocystaceae bacterium]
MDIQALTTLIVATAIMALVPGPVVAALVGRALFGGARSTIGFVLGVFLADLIWLLAAVSGLGFVAASYSTVFLVIKYLGAAYLIYLGANAVRHALARNQEIQIPKSQGKAMGFLSGFLVTMGNPKLVAFYISFLPTFMDIQALQFNDVVLAAMLVPTTFALFNFGWALCASKARNFFKSSAAMRSLNLISGGFLLGAGAFIMSED